MTLIFIWYLLTTPIDRLECSLWVSHSPTIADLSLACGSWPISANMDNYVWKGIELSNAAVVCERPASELPLMTCVLLPWDKFLISIYWHDFVEISCAVVITHTGPPSADEISAKCGQVKADDYAAGKLRLEYQGQLTHTEPPPPCSPPALTIGPGLYDMPVMPGDLATGKDYYLLAGRLIWWGLVKPHCDGWSGIDPWTGAATECGMIYARSRMIEWQNSFDGQLYEAAQQTNVPPRLLKAVMGLESQFWPLWVPPADERGLIQLTEAGADIALRYSPEIYAEICPLATADCSGPYDTRSGDVQLMIRAVLLGHITHSDTFPILALEASRKDVLTYSRVLSAYYCYTAELISNPSWETVMFVYHSGSECLAGCDDGLDYLKALEQ